MAEISIGSVVVSLRGNDKGRIMMVIGKSGKYLLVCDGKKRKKASPKRKNPCHLRVLLSEDAPQPVNAELTDGELRRYLARFRDVLCTECDQTDRQS